MGIAMEFDLAFDAWETPEFPGLRMRYPGFREPPSLLTLAGRRRDLLREDHPPRQLHEDEFLGIVGREFGGFLARWGLSELVSERTSRLAELRDIARRQPRRRGGAGAAVRQNQKVQAELLPLSGDAQALASDVDRLTEDARLFEHNVVDFYAVKGNARRLVRARVESQVSNESGPAPRSSRLRRFRLFSS
jgi:hypothetical protein